MCTHAQSKHKHRCFSSSPGLTGNLSETSKSLKLLTRCFSLCPTVIGMVAQTVGRQTYNQQVTGSTRDEDAAVNDSVTKQYNLVLLSGQ